MEINLIHLIKDKNLGGSTTHLVHFYKTLEGAGLKVNLIKLHKKESIVNREMYYGIRGQAMGIRNLIDKISKPGQKNIITYCFWKEYKKECKLLLLNTDIKMFVHDPAEFHEDFIEFARKHKIKIYTIRETNKKSLNKLGVDAEFIPHIFIPSEFEVQKNKLCCSIARIDFRKHTDVLVSLNMKEDVIDIYGELNRLMDYHKLIKIDPEWRRNWKGRLPEIFNVQVKIASEYKYFVDLTNIKGDGGGTQYSFFEAMNAGCYLILNRKWVSRENSIFVEGKNCLCVESKEELEEILKSGAKYDLEENKKILQNYSPYTVLPILKKYNLI